jgi:hypothetical protein
MLTIKTKNIIVSIFYDMNGSISPTVEEKWGYQVLLHSVRIAFEVKYLPTLQVLLDDASGSRNMTSSSNVCILLRFFPSLSFFVGISVSVSPV